MDLSAIIKAVLAPQIERSGQTLPNLLPGDKLVGKVLQLERDGRVLIDLGGSRVLAQVGFAVKQGQNLRLTVVEKGPLLHLRADLPASPAMPSAAQTRIIKAVPATQPEHGGKTPLDLQPGDKLAGQVVRMELDGRALIDLEGSRVLARLGFAVKSGQSLRLDVVEGGPPLLLRVDSQAGHSRQALTPQANLSAALTSGERQELIRTIEGIIPRLAMQGKASAMSRTIFNALHQISAAFDSLPMGKPAMEIAQWLRGAMENHGGLFEKRLADMARMEGKPPKDVMATAGREPEQAVRAVITQDVKPQLIILKRFLQGGDASQPTDLKFAAKETTVLRDGVDKMLYHLEHQQERAVARSREGEPFQLFSHLLPMPDRQPPVRLKVYYPRKDGQGGADGSHRIALLLEMDRLGLVRGDIAKRADTLQINFFVQDENIRDLFNEKLSEFKTALKGRFEQVRVEVSVSKEKIAKFHDEDHQGAAPGRIDIKA